MKLNRSLLALVAGALLMFALPGCAGGGGDAQPGQDGRWNQMDWDSGRWS